MASPNAFVDFIGSVGNAPASVASAAASSGGAAPV